MIPGERIIELSLELALEIVKGQPPDVKAQMWRWHVEDTARLRKWLGIDAGAAEGQGRA